MESVGGGDAEDSAAISGARLPFPGVNGTVHNVSPPALRLVLPFAAWRSWFAAVLLVCGGGKKGFAVRVARPPKLSLRRRPSVPPPARSLAGDAPLHLARAACYLVGGNVRRGSGTRERYPCGGTRGTHRPPPPPRSPLTAKRICLPRSARRGGGVRCCKIGTPAL